jgi:hypothetical protein
MPLLQTCRLETTSLCLNSRLVVNKKFPNSHYFYWNYCKRFTFMWSPRNDKYSPSCSKNYLSMKSLLRTSFLCFSWFSFFAFWEAEKHVFNIVPFRPTRNVLKFFRCLAVSNRMRYRDKVKNNIYVRSKLPLCQLEIRIFINNLMC